MPRIGWIACWAALTCPAVALAGEKAAESKPPAGAAGAPETAAAAPGDAEAVAAARTDLDALLGALMVEKADPGPAQTTGLQLEVPPPIVTSEAPTAVLRPEPGTDLDWLQGLELPDIPIRWHDQLLQLLSYYRDDPRGRAHIRTWLQRSGRYEAMIRAKLADSGLPRDLLFVAMVESGFDPVIRSHAAAVGLWQLVGSTAEEYGLEQTRWIDQRRSPELATEAAIRYLKDLHDRLGSWPLSLAAFNMGYGALLRSVRKYNTNDYWLLARLEAGLPYETVVYVAKIMACAIVARNPERFGLGDLVKDAPVQFATVEVPGGSPLSALASAAAVPAADLALWNPELLRQRVPPDVKQWSLRIPSNAHAQFARRWPQLQRAEPRYAMHLLRFGEDLGDIADMYGTTERKLRALNDLNDDEAVQAGVRIKVPSVAPESDKDELPVVAVPKLSFSYPTRRHIFYRVQSGDRAEQIAKFFRVEMRELRLWNAISPDAFLHAGMILQLYVPKEVDLSRAVYLEPARTRQLVVGSQEFLDYHEGLRDRVRVRYRIQQGDSLASLAERYDLSVGSICRINGFDRNQVLKPGSELILYTKVREPTPTAASTRRAETKAKAKKVEPRAPRPKEQPRKAAPPRPEARQTARR